MKNNFLPSFLDNTNFRYLKLDNKYLASTIITDYPKKISFIQIIESIPKDLDYDLSMFIQKQDTNTVLKQLTYHISSSGTEIKTVNENQVDIDILSKIKEDAKNLRKDIQINNEQVYFLNICITFYSENERELLTILKNFQSKLYSKQISTNITNFRHLDLYLLSLPFNNFNSKILRNGYRNITTSTLANFFPFYNKTMFDEKGIVFGYTKNENKIFNLDIFDSKYLNSNMCIFGSSGSGKSYFTKLIIIRNFLKEKKQYIFDPEGEYSEIVESLGGEVIDFLSVISNNFFNLLEITSFELEEYKENFFDKKIEKTTKFLMKMCNLTTKEDEEKITKSIIKSYEIKGINKEVKSLYLFKNQNNVLVDKSIKPSSFFPNIIDIIENLNNKKISSLIEKNILSKYPVFSKNSDSNSNIHTKNLISFNTSNIQIKDAIYIIEFFLDNILLELKNNKNNEKTIIYIDEVWKYIYTKEASNLSETIFKFFKTIRKYGGSIVTITQDISDFFSYEDGNFGKSILNNSGFKMFFKLDFSDLEILEKLSLMNTDSLSNISKLDKGQVFLGFKNNNVILNVKSNEYEEQLIKGGEIL